MKQSNLQLAAVTGGIVMAVALRLLPHPPNFSTLAATALFGGASLARRRLAFLVPLATLFLTDLILVSTSYTAAGVAHAVSWPLVPFIYGSMILTAALGCWLRSRRSVLTIAGTALAGSILFFLITNFGVWATANWYPHTFGGLFACYVAAIPFFGNELAGDASATLVLFGGFALAQSRVAALRDSAGAAPVV